MSAPLPVHSEAGRRCGLCPCLYSSSANPLGRRDLGPASTAATYGAHWLATWGIGMVGVRACWKRVAAVAASCAAVMTAIWSRRW